MANYLTVWCPDRGQSEAEGRAISDDGFGDGIRHVAERFAEYHAGFSGDPFKSLDVYVRDKNGGLHQVSVDVVPVPSFETVSIRTLTQPRKNATRGEGHDDCQ